MERLFLDARELEHPIPLERAIEALRKLEEGRNYFYMLHRKEPIPLIEMAKAQGYDVYTKEENNRWHILIARRPEIPLEELCDV